MTFTTVRGTGAIKEGFMKLKGPFRGLCACLIVSHSPRGFNCIGLQGACNRSWPNLVAISFHM